MAMLAYNQQALSFQVIFPREILALWFWRR